MTSKENADRLSWTYPATLNYVEQVCLAATTLFEKHMLSKRDRFAIELLLREAVNNAVIHGCSENAQMHFTCQLEISDQKAIIEVADEGPGFNWRKKSQASPSDLEVSGRGLTIFEFYANSIKYNDAGNCVTLTRRFEPQQVE